MSEKIKRNSEIEDEFRFGILNSRTGSLLGFEVFGVEVRSFFSLVVRTGKSCCVKSISRSSRTQEHAIGLLKATKFLFRRISMGGRKLNDDVLIVGQSGSDCSVAMDVCIHGCDFRKNCMLKGRWTFSFRFLTAFWALCC